MKYYHTFILNRKVRKGWWSANYFVGCFALNTEPRISPRHVVTISPMFHNPAKYTAWLSRQIIKHGFPLPAYNDTIAAHTFILASLGLLGRKATRKALALPREHQHKLLCVPGLILLPSRITNTILQRKEQP